MKILAIHTGAEDSNTPSPVDIWRIWRPLRELKKHVDWEIHEQPSVIKEIDKYKDSKEFTPEEMEKSYDHLKQYDVIWASYSSFLNPMTFVLCLLLHEKEGVKLVVDIDDNVFSINRDNIGWWLKMDDDKTWDVQTVILKAPYITTSTKVLAAELRRRRSQPEDTVKVVPNFISKDYQSAPPDNGDVIKVGYFGGASHYDDVHQTGVIDALEKLMHENKQVHVYSVGIPFEQYLPKQRYHYLEGKRGHEWISDLFPSLQFDIALAPLTSSAFNRSKSDIKWQEAAIMRAAFVGSRMNPYVNTVRHETDGLIVDNTAESWYEALKRLVDDKDLRNKLAQNAKERVIKELLIENNWQTYQRAFKEIHDAR